MKETVELFEVELDIELLDRITRAQVPEEPVTYQEGLPLD